MNVLRVGISLLLFWLVWIMGKKKAGIKKDDVITEVDGKAVNSTDDMVKMIKDSKEKISIMVKLQRAGKTQNIEVKMPRKIKTADL